MACTGGCGPGCCGDEPGGVIQVGSGGVRILEDARLGAESVLPLLTTARNASRPMWSAPNVSISNNAVGASRSDFQSVSDDELETLLHSSLTRPISVTRLTGTITPAKFQTGTDAGDFVDWPCIGTCSGMGHGEAYFMAKKTKPSEKDEVKNQKNEAAAHTRAETAAAKQCWGQANEKCPVSFIPCSCNILDDIHVTSLPTKYKEKKAFMRELERGIDYFNNRAHMGSQLDRSQAREKAAELQKEKDGLLTPGSKSDWNWGDSVGTVSVGMSCGGNCWKGS